MPVPRPVEEEISKRFGENQDVSITKREIMCLVVPIRDSLRMAIMHGAVAFKFGYPGMSEECSGKGEFPTRCLVHLDDLRDSCLRAYQTPPKLPEGCEGEITQQNNFWVFQGFYFGESLLIQLLPQKAIEPNTIEFHC